MFVHQAWLFKYKFVSFSIKVAHLLKQGSSVWPLNTPLLIFIILKVIHLSRYQQHHNMKRTTNITHNVTKISSFASSSDIWLNIWRQYSLLDVPAGIIQSCHGSTYTSSRNDVQLETWANAQRDGRPAEYRWCLCSTPQSLADAQYWSAVQ